MMNNKHTILQLLQGTIVWQGLLLVGLTFFWLFVLVIYIITYSVYYDGSSRAAYIYNGLVVVSYFIWTGYLLLQLHRTRKTTQIYCTNRKNIYWEQAMQQQQLFWKYLFLLFAASVLLVALTLFYHAFIGTIGRSTAQKNVSMITANDHIQLTSRLMTNRTELFLLSFLDV